MVLYLICIMTLNKLLFIPRLISSIMPEKAAEARRVFDIKPQVLHVFADDTQVFPTK